MIDLILYFIVMYIAIYMPDVLNYIFQWIQTTRRLRESSEGLVEKYKDM